MGRFARDKASSKPNGVINMRAIRNPLARASVWLFTLSCVPLGMATAGDFNSPALRLTQPPREFTFAQADNQVPPNAPAPPDVAIPPMITQEAPMNSAVYPANPVGEFISEC